MPSNWHWRAPWNLKMSVYGIKEAQDAPLQLSQGYNISKGTFLRSYLHIHIPTNKSTRQLKEWWTRTSEVQPLVLKSPHRWCWSNTWSAPGTRWPKINGKGPWPILVAWPGRQKCGGGGDDDDDDDNDDDGDDDDDVSCRFFLMGIESISTTFPENHDSLDLCPSQSFVCLSCVVVSPLSQLIHPSCQPSCWSGCSVARYHCVCMMVGRIQKRTR